MKGSLCVASYPNRRSVQDSLRRTISLRVELACMRQDVAFAVEQFAMAERRVCKLVGLDRSAVDESAELSSL